MSKHQVDLMGIRRAAGRRFFRWCLSNASWLHRFWPGEISKPVFVVGCPRSGTTVFGKILSRMPGIAYLNEARHIWCGVNPTLDVWAYKYPIESGILYWDGQAVTWNDSIRLRRWFHLEMVALRKKRLIEKIPENAFRMRWLRAIFPDAKFIHIVRHGRDVALSLSIAVNKWFPAGYWATSRHFEIFREYAADRVELAPALALLSPNADTYARSLFVWCCAVTECRNAGAELGWDSYVECRYEDLIQSPHAALQRVFEFIHEPQLADLAARVAKELMHEESVNKPDPDPQVTQAMAGKLLSQFGYDAGDRAGV